jgi:hypothetical protein
MTLTQAIEQFTASWPYEVGIRVQRGREASVGGVGTKLRPSSEWVDGNKTRRKLSGTAGYSVADADQLPEILKIMAREGHTVDATDRLVVIQGTQSHDDGMAELYGRTFVDAVIVAVINDVPAEIRRRK